MLHLIWIGAALWLLGSLASAAGRRATQRHAETQMAHQRQALAQATMALSDDLDAHADRLQAELDRRLAEGPPGAATIDLRQDSRGVYR